MSMSKFKVTVSIPKVYFLEALSFEEASGAGIQHAQFYDRPAYELGPSAEVERMEDEAPVKAMRRRVASAEAEAER